MTYPTAIGCGCLLGAGGAHAAEWSLQPILSWTTDYDNNRSLSQGVQGSEQAVLSADVRLERSLENLQFMLEPRFDVRRFSDSRWGPGDDRSVSAAFSRSTERSQISLNGSFADQNTLTTELLETGIVDTNTRRRSETAGGSFTLSQTEKRLFFTQVSYLGSSYSGPQYAEELLPGYRYESAALGERFVLTEHLTLSASAFGDILHSDRAGSSSHEAGGQLELNYAHSELLSFDLQVGESRRNLYGSASNGTSVVASVTRNFERSTASLSYSRTLVPYGNGFLVERQQVTAFAKHSLTTYLDADITAVRIQNNDSTVQLHLDRRFYDTVSGGLTWKLGERWTLRSDAGTIWCPLPGSTDHTVHEWHAALTMTWKPTPKVVSR